MRLWVFGAGRARSGTRSYRVALGTTRGAARPNTTIPDVFLPVHVTDDGLAHLARPEERPSRRRGAFHDQERRDEDAQLHARHRAKPGTGYQVGFSTTLKPKQEKVFLLFLDYRGALPYHSIIKADLKKPGMRGIFKIL